MSRSLARCATWRREGGDALRAERNEQVTGNAFKCERGEGDTWREEGKKGLIMWGVGFHCLRSFFLSFIRIE
jgi:hypothetical protein